MKLARLLCMVFAVVAFTSACAPSEERVADRVRVDTLESGLVRITNDGVGLWTADEVWTLEEEWRLGSVDAEGPEQFADIGAIITDADDRLYVLEYQAGDIRVFLPSGEYSHTIGRKGQGPGELESAWGLSFSPAGELWVWDSGNQGYSVFQPSGEFVTSYRRELSGVFIPFSGGHLPDGRFMDWYPNTPIDPATGPAWRGHVHAPSALHSSGPVRHAPTVTDPASTTPGRQSHAVPEGTHVSPSSKRATLVRPYRRVSGLRAHL